MKNTYCKRKYKCKCGAIQDQFVWQSELNKHTFKCEHCKKSIGIEQLKVKETIQATSIRTPTRNR